MDVVVHARFVLREGTDVEGTLRDARGAEAAHEACASLCMSHWSARGGQKASTARGAQKTRLDRGANDFAFLACASA